MQAQGKEMLFINCNPQRSLSDRERFLEEAQKKSYAAVAAHRNRQLSSYRNLTSTNFLAEPPSTTLDQDMTTPSERSEDDDDNENDDGNVVVSYPHQPSVVEVSDDLMSAAMRPSEMDSRSIAQRYVTQIRIPELREASPYQSSVLISNDIAAYDESGLSYFVTMTLPRISSLDDRTFWEETLIPLAMSNNGLKYALSSLGLLHQTWSLRGEKGSMIEDANHRARALEQYCHAINSLTKDPSTTKIVMMHAAIVFIAIETLFDTPDQGLRHYRAGLAIAHEWRCSDQNIYEVRLFEDSILPVLRRLELRFGSADDQLPPYYYLRRNPERRCPLPLGELAIYIPRRETDYMTLYNLPAVFESVADSSQTLRKIARTMSYRVKQDLHDRPVEEHLAKCVLADGLALVWAWRSNFERFLVMNKDSMDKKSIVLATFQEAYFNFLLIQLQTSLSLDEMVFDAYDSEFRAINALCHRYLILESDLVGRPSRELFHRFEASIMVMVSFTANRCRDPLIRRDAIKILEDFHFVESTIPSFCLALWARQLVHLEERHCDRPPRTSQDVAKHHRLQSLDVSQYIKPFDSMRITSGHLQVSMETFDDDSESMQIESLVDGMKATTNYDQRCAGCTEISAAQRSIEASSSTKDLSTNTENYKVRRDDQSETSRSDEPTASCPASLQLRFLCYPYSTDSDIELQYVPLNTIVTTACDPSLYCESPWTYHFNELGNFEMTLGATVWDTQVKLREMLD